MSRLRLCGVGMWGWLLYLLGSAGYFVADSLAALNMNLDESSWDVMYTALAAVFLLDSLVYLVEWLLDTEPPRKLDSAFWANAVNVAASLFLVASAGLFLVYPRDEGYGSLYKERAIVQSALNLSAVLLYALDALLYGSEYYNARLDMTRVEKADRPLLREPHFFSEVLNNVSSLGYLATGVVQLFSILNRVVDPAGFRRLQASLSLANLVFDLMYGLNALQCAWAWWTDYNAQYSVKEVAVHTDHTSDEEHESLLRLGIN